MKMANEALVIFLKSLPEQCYFNIVSFGSNYKKLFSESRQATEDNIQNTCNQVERFTASFGGTEINSPLHASYGSKKLKHLPKLVFLLTDGDVGNPDSVISLAKMNSKNCRTFTIGVGNGASPYLVREIAKHGRGKYEIILNNELLSEKMSYLLEASLSPVLDDFRFEFDKKVVEFMTPCSGTQVNILKNEQINLFVFLNEKFTGTTNLTVRYFNSVTSKDEEIVIVMERKNAVNVSDSVQKLGSHSVIRELEAGLLDKSNPDIYFAKK